MEPLIPMEIQDQIQRMISAPGHVQDVIRQEVPMLCADWGAKDEDALLHTLGVNLLTALGRSFGYVALTEYPVPRAQRWQHKLVRVDSSWIDRDSRSVVVLSEFERFSREAALEKVTNLYVAGHGCDGPPNALLLCLWSLDGVAVDAPWLTTEQPLPVTGGPPVSRPDGSEVFLVHAVFGRRGEHLHFLRFRRLA